MRQYLFLEQVYGLEDRLDLIQIFFSKFFKVDRMHDSLLDIYK